MKLKLRGKIIAWSFIPATIILVIVALVNFQAYQQVTEELVVQRNRELARLLAGRLSSEQTELLDRLELIARSLPEPVDAAALQQTLAWSDPQLLEILDGGVILLNYLGENLASATLDGTLLPQKWNQMDLFNQIDRRGLTRAAVTDLGRLGTAGPDYLAFVVPLQSQPAILAGLIRLDGSAQGGFERFITNVRLEDSGQVTVVDGFGRVLHSPSLESRSVDRSDEAPVQAVLAGKVASLRTTSSDGRDIVLSYAPVIGSRWGLLIEEDWSSLVASSQGYAWFLIALLALGILLPTAVVALGVQRLTTPIRRLTQLTGEVASGKFGQTLEVKSGDEVQELAEGFNRMSLELQESYLQLEERVAARTRELATVNRIASVASSSLELKEVLRSALLATQAPIQIPCGAVLLREAGQPGLRLALSEGLSPEFIQKVAWIPDGEGAAGEAARTGQPLARQVQEYPPGALRQALEAEGLQTVISTPLIARGKILGVLNLCARQPRRLTSSELEMLAAIGSQTGIAVENARLYEKAEESAVTAERTRLARELHDAVTQTIFAASLIADVLPRIWERNPDQGRAKLEELRLLNRGALAEMRSLLLELRPAALLEASLPELFGHLVNAFTGRTRLPVDLRLEGDCPVSPEEKVVLYRVAQLALNNIHQHAAGATLVALHLACLETGLFLTISDNGCGFDAAQEKPGHFGLSNMQERAAQVGGTLTIHSQPGEGTQIILAIPRG